MKKYIVLHIILIISPYTVLFGQDKWSLDDCITYALENNVNIKMQKLNVSTGRIMHDKSKLNYLPSLDFNTNYQFSIGRSLDPTTYSFIENKKVSTLNANINLNATLFDGMKRYNIYRKSLVDLGISSADYEALKNDISLSVTLGYMNILLNKEIIHSVRQQLEISENNIGKARRLYEEGVLTEDKLQSIMLQKDNELYSLAEAEGSLRSSILSLCSLLNIRNYDSFDVKEDTSFVFNDSIPYADVITVVHSLPQIKSAKGKVNSAEYSLKIAQGDLYPTISLGTATASSFSGARQRPLLDKSGNPVVGESGIVFRNYPFINQLSDNRNSYIALTFNMPLFGIFQTNKNISLARNNIRLAQYEMENTEKNMTEQLFQVYTEVDMARKKYKAALSSVERGKIILVHARNKLSNGTLTVSDYMIEKENMLIAEAQASKAKYEYFFKICLLKFYCAIK